MSADVADARESHADDGMPRMQTGSDPERGRWDWIVLVVLVIAVFARTVGFGLFNDDYFLLRPWSAQELRNVFHGQFDQIAYVQTYYRPLASVSFAIEWKLWGTNRWGYHLTNIAIHVVAVLCLWAFLRRLRVPRWGALAGAAFFAVVPSNVAAVVYIAERTDAMVGLLVCLILLFVWRYAVTRRQSQLWLALGLYVVSLMCKEVATATLPFVAVLWLFARMQAVDTSGNQEAPTFRSHWANEARTLWRALSTGAREWLRVVAPFALVTVVYLVYRSAVLPPDSLSGRVLGGLQPVKSLGSGFKYTLEGVPWEISPLPFLPLVAAFVLAFVLRPRSRWWRVVLFGFLGIVSGVLPLAPSGSVEPRGLYVAEIGLAIAVAGLAMVFAEAFAARDRYAALARPAIVAVVLAFLVTTAVSHVRSQNLYRPGSAASLKNDVNTYTDPRAYVIVPANLEVLREHLRDAGLLDENGNVITDAGGGS